MEQAAVSVRESPRAGRAPAVERNRHEPAWIERARVTAIPPQWLALLRRCTAPAIPPAERAGLLTTIQLAAPAPVFAEIFATVKPHVGERDWAMLCAAIGPLSVGA
jgi:hypothetical protein